MESFHGIALNSNGRLTVPDFPVIPFIEGDGTSPDIWRATQKVVDSAVQKAYSGKKKIQWLETLAVEKGFHQTGEWLPAQTLEAIERHVVAIKGPLTTPVGKDIRSVNVTLRQKLDLYARIRLVCYIQGVPSPMKHPEKVNMVIFRENTEDVYASIEWPSGSEDAEKVIRFLRETMGVQVPDRAGIGIKPMSPQNSKRPVAAAISHAIENQLPSGYPDAQGQHHEIHRRCLLSVGI